MERDERLFILIGRSIITDPIENFGKEPVKFLDLLAYAFPKPKMILVYNKIEWPL